MLRRFANLLFASLALSLAVAAQTAALNVGEFRLESKLMGREMPYRVLLPRSYDVPPKPGGAWSRYPVLYLLHGLTGHYDNWTAKTKIAEYAARYGIIVVTPEGGDGWYTDSAGVPNDKFESYIVLELVPEIEKRFRAGTDRSQRMIAGLSMGGYGALKFGLKYPERFAVAGSFSGALRAAEWTDRNSGAWLSKSTMAVFGPADSETRRANDIFRLVREMPADKVAGLPFLYLDCGTEDFLIGINVDFAALLREKKIPHEFRTLPGRHDWVYWDAQVAEFLALADRRTTR